MSRDKCVHCGWSLGFCAMGEYCTNPECSYIDGHYSGPRVVIPSPKVYSEAEVNALRKENEELKRALSFWMGVGPGDIPNTKPRCPKCGSYKLSGPCGHTWKIPSGGG